MNWFNGFLKNRKESTLQLMLIAGIAITANVLASEVVLRLDLTEDNRYTLSAASRNIAESLDEPVTVTAYYSENLPPQLENSRQEFQNFLEEFRAFSKENLEYDFRNPNENKQTEQKAQMAGVRPVMIDVRERDQISQKRAYMGAVFRYGDKREVVPVIRPGASLEYTIASTIKQLTLANKPKIGFLQGHGEPALQEMVQLKRELEQRYEVVEVTGLDTAAVSPDMEALLIVAPKQKLSEQELRHIDQYIMSGGRALFAINRIQANLQGRMAMPVSTGIERLLSAYNVPVKPNLVRDNRAANIQVRQRQGVFSVVNRIQYPYLPLVSNFGDHPISSGLETVLFQFVSSLDTTQTDSTQKLTVLAKSSDQAGLARGRFNLNPMQEWEGGSFSLSDIPLGAAVKGTFRSAFAGVDSVDVPLEKSRQTSLVVFGDGNFIVNGRGQRQQRLPDDNINLMVNSVDWLADDTGLIALRTKGVTNRPLQRLSQTTKTFLKYLNTFLPIALVIGYGLYRFRIRKIRRRRWMESGI